MLSHFTFQAVVSVEGLQKTDQRVGTEMGTNSLHMAGAYMY